MECGDLRPADVVTWSAAQYVEFEDQRTRPVRDLLAAIPPLQPRRAIDIGCGPGNSTELLAARYPAASVHGFDSSPDMIAAARTRLPDIGFDVRSIDQWVSDDTESVDVILANAVLQWLPDHAVLLPALLGKLSAGGVLAVQMPDNLEQPAQVAMREIAAVGGWAQKLATASAARSALADPSWYCEILRAQGCVVDVWRTTYHHPLPGGAADVVEWFKGSGLRPFLSPLNDRERDDFLLQYRRAIESAYPALADGSVLLPFPRLFMVAVRA